VGDAPHIRITVNSDTRYLGAIRTVLREATRLVGLGDEDAAEVELAVTEALANVIRHCYKNCADEVMDIDVRVKESELEIQVDDYGTFVDPSQIKSRELHDVRPGGLGVHLMKKVMDEVRFERNEWGGTRLTMRKRAAHPHRERSA
jgi:anti-sigma regulatory factor (Ser/Thr protein kinase)